MRSCHMVGVSMRTSLTCFASLLLGLSPIRAAEPVDYLREIKPILNSRCYACHGALRQKAKLRLDTADLIRKGGRSGPALVAGNSGASVLIDAVTGRNDVSRMPPKGEGEPLSEKQIDVLKRWIDQGAMAPNEPIPEVPRKHWAFQPPVRPPLPKPSDRTWVSNPIDAFVAIEHDRHGLKPQPRADRSALLRRVYLDLIGLPPNRDELHAFLADPSADAYEKVVDRLLASPHYGERWGRHWMDVWRYSDWYGRRGVPDVWNSAPQIWRWRDWIVRSLNTDKGYDQMVREMLAADEITPEDDENIVATGYLVRNWYALNYNQWMRDIVEHTGKAFLGLTLNCAHCHDHKYDPISHEEYFRFRAFFEPLELRQDRVRGEPDPGLFQKYDYAKLRKIVHLGSIRVFDERPNAQTYMYTVGDERNRIAGRPPVAPGAPAILGGDQLSIEPVTLSPTAYYPGLKPFIQRDELKRAEQVVAEASAALSQNRLALDLARQQLALIEGLAESSTREPRAVEAKTQALARYHAAEAAIPLTEAHVVSAEAELRSIQTRIAADNIRFKREPGNLDDLASVASKAERFAALCAARERLVQAELAVASAKPKAETTAAGKAKDQALTALKKAEQQQTAAAKALESAQKALDADDTRYTPLSPVYPTTSTGRRRALAQWLTGRDNPLAARVAVNHIWLRHFDRALVETVFDFGRNGKKPSHPALLDWLAVEFTESNWSMKHLHRLIVTSNTYRMQSTPGKDGPNLALDSDNRWLWRFNARRMEAETLRDSLLHSAGELDPTIGGQVLETVQEMTSRRRSLYYSVFPEGGGHLKFLEMFDAPDPCDCYRRAASIIPQQALALTNSQLALNQSRLLARKLGNQLTLAPSNESAFIDAAFEHLLSRLPTDQERLACLEFLHKQVELFRESKVQPVADGNPQVSASGDPAMRARESLIRVLFNHDDFVTIR